MNKRYALVDNSNKAVNFITWDGVTAFDYGQGKGFKLVSLDGIERYDIGWTWNGSTFVPPTPTVEVPKSITPRQCRLILYQQGLLPTVEAMIQSSTEDVRITWEYALEFRRDDPLLTQLAANLGLTSQQIDEFFIAASQIS